MDSFSAAHQRLSPVLADANGSDTGNTMCIGFGPRQSRHVPPRRCPGLDPGRPSAPTSSGGPFGCICAIQMAALHPGIYPSVIALSGEAEPASAQTAAPQYSGRTGAATPQPFPPWVPDVMSRTR
jgi:hypothetical protein